jgi:exodeoxyribonuclease V beta subunit
MSATPLNVFTCKLSGTSLIEASAGTGKTWNICGLYLRLLLEARLEVQQILVVTFTKAATAELRERIRSRIAETLARLRGAAAAAGDPFVDQLLQSLREQHGLADDDLMLRLDLALQTFDEASIFTIHGFCQRALADTAFTAGLPMAVELLADDTDLRMQVVHDFWRSHVAAEALPVALGNYLLSRKDTPEKWGALLKRQLAKPLSRVIWPAALDTAAPVDTAALNAAHAAAAALWQSDRPGIVDTVTEALPRLNGVSYKASTVETAFASWDALLAARDPLAAPGKLDKLDLLTPERLKPKAGQQPPQHHPFFEQAATLLACLDETNQTLALARQRLLRQLLAEGPGQLGALKRERRVVAFDDMLQNLHERVTSPSQPWLAAALRKRFPAALIDEFQDTDPLQFAIFKTIYGGSGLPLFMVGDPKQAIYSFRNADLHTYLQARHEAAAEYTLAENQRSTQALLTGLNALFSANPRAFVLDGLSYQPVGCGQKPRKTWQDTTQPRSPLQLWQLPPAADGRPANKRAAQRAAAEACAGEVARLINGAQRGEILQGGKPLAGGDIAVLVRSHAQGGAMRQALAALGVGSVELSQASVFQSTDAEDLERVLAAVLEPARERMLRAALSTVMLGFDAAAIEAASAQEGQLLGFVTRFTEYREQWLRRGVGVMLRSLMVREGVAARMLARADGERRLTNLLHLSEGLHQASETHASPELQLRWLQTQRAERSGEDAAQLRLESDRNLVQIITIHKSKGLEYPVVFCPFLWNGHPGGAPDGLEGREYHDDDGLPVLDFSIEPKATNKGKSKSKDAPEDPEDRIKQRLALEKAAENLRLVYVALTRAVQRLYLVVGTYTNKSGRGTGTTESTRSPLNSLVAGAGQSPAEWRESKLEPDAVHAAWQLMQEAHPGCIGLEPLPAGPWARVEPVRLAPDALAALPAPGRIPSAWWIGSYSSLSQGVRHEGAAVDHDARVALSTPLAERSESLPDQSVEADDILNFPRGAEAGNCMHAVFERVDFTDPATWPAAIDTALREQPQAQAQAHAGSELSALLPRMLNRMLADVLNTRLPGGLVLSGVTRARRLVELEFNLPATQLAAGAMTALLREYGYPVPLLGFGTLDGYLLGFIDLIVEHEGRFHILDWKSNHLGRVPAAYAAAPVGRAMREHGYHLQFLLYTVALHRYLGRRLPGYRYEDHFGGAMYLFVRGVRPGWMGADGGALGVHVDRPPQELVERLSALFAGHDIAREAA